MIRSTDENLARLAKAKRGYMEGRLHLDCNQEEIERFAHELDAAGYQWPSKTGCASKTDCGCTKAQPD